MEKPLYLTDRLDDHVVRLAALKLVLYLNKSMIWFEDRATADPQGGHCRCREGRHRDRPGGGAWRRIWPSAGATASEGMAPHPSRRRKTIIEGAKIGRTSQATKIAQAVRDTRGV